MGSSDCTILRHQKVTTRRALAFSILFNHMKVVSRDDCDWHRTGAFRLFIVTGIYALGPFEA